MSGTTEFERLMLDLFRELKGEIESLKTELKADIHEVKEDMRKGFEQVDKRFEQVDKRFEQVEHRLERIEDDVRADRDKLQQVYESRDKVKITFGWQWAMVSFFIALVAVSMSKIF